jgi:hypothetical protein
MCDYSQQLAARRFCRRRAMVGDELELISFGHGWLRGFAKRWRGRWLLTCIRHGSEIAFEQRQVLHDCRSFVECDNGERILVNDIMPREARFISAHHGGDVLEFSNGLQCGISAIDLGARIKVLQVPASKRRKRSKTGAPPSVRQRELETVER